MLNIQPVSLIRNNYSLKNNNISSPKLKPLACDTVSFSGARNLNHSLLEAFDNKESCDVIYENAKIPADNLRKSLRNAFYDIAPSKSVDNPLVAPVKVRIKTAESIREKAASKFEEAILSNNKDNFVNLNEIDGIKYLVGDIIGARIVVNQSDTKTNAQIINRLIKLVKKGELKVKEIEIIMPDSLLGITPYFDEPDIDRLRDEVNKKSKDKIEVKKTVSESGYSALHLDIDLTNPNLPLKNAGYKGEIQIMGADVAYFKDLEDYCYKVKQNKNINAGHFAYSPFVDHLNKYLLTSEGKINEKNKRLFNEYTYKAYIVQRKKDSKNPDYNRNLPSLAECGMEDKIPPQYDFNYLQRIKEYCDRLYALTNVK